MQRLNYGLVALITLWTVSLAQADDPLAKRAAAALRKAADYFDQHVSCEGSYLWRYSPDLKYREGEETATVTQGWLQPPGTPSVGQALLSVYLLTGDEHYLKLAQHTARSLIRGQLESGCWAELIEFDPAKRGAHAYRVDQLTDLSTRRNTSTLDDNKSQSALRFLMRLDAATQFQDTVLHEAVLYALERLIVAQYPNGAWPQRFSGPPDAAQYPVKKASYPASWSRTWPGAKYATHYTFNDNAMSDVVDVMLEAAQTYEQAQYRAAAIRCGEFILLAQMPAPQPIWAQQYDADMHPAWARKFEPPSVTGGESQGVIATLLRIYRSTGERKFLDACEPALKYLKRVELAPGRMARFYELKTDRPLYFTKDYQLTYDDSDLPTHYGFKLDTKVDTLQAEYDRLASMAWNKLPPDKPWLSLPTKSKGPSEAQRREVEQLLDTLDASGRWLSAAKFAGDGKPSGYEQMITTETFVKNVTALARYLSVATSK